MERNLIFSVGKTWNNLLTWGLAKWFLKDFGSCCTTASKNSKKENFPFLLHSSMNENCAQSSKLAGKSKSSSS